MIRSMPCPSSRFAVVLQDLMSQQRLTQSQERGPLIISGCIDHDDLRFLIKLSLSLTRGCVRHLVYLCHHLGGCLQGCDANIAASLIPEYRDQMKAISHELIVSRQSCPLEGLGKKLSHANHLFYLIMNKLARSSGRFTREESLSYIIPGDSRSLKLNGSITLSEIRFLRRLADSLCIHPQKTGILPHILFMSLAAGILEKGGEPPRSSCSEIQRKYRAYITAKTIRLMVKNQMMSVVMDGKGTTCRECLSGSGSSFFREIFDTVADEYLVKTAASYLEHMINKEAAPSMTERKKPEYDDLRSLAE